MGTILALFQITQLPELGIALGVIRKYDCIDDESSSTCGYSLLGRICFENYDGIGLDGFLYRFCDFTSGRFENPSVGRKPSEVSQTC